ncbi:hypothetical protein EVAR_25008_1 [Eumeta japonica]|uniref:Uncharacterized protein n=1 Tax=Eumeta variegata TaxID=151549 RepID=A0A4C1XIU1_EUMVA|nr:hypothetical protein EVAR_25008_1 [Eumeta japonica]
MKMQGRPHSRIRKHRLASGRRRRRVACVSTWIAVPDAARRRSVGRALMSSGTAVNCRGAVGAARARAAVAQRHARRRP